MRSRRIRFLIAVLFPVWLISLYRCAGPLKQNDPSPGPPAGAQPEMRPAADLPAAMRILSLIGKTADQFVLPKPEETYYRIQARMPLIDQLSARPWAIPDYCDLQAGRMSRAVGFPEMLEIHRQMLLLKDLPDPPAGESDTDPKKRKKPVKTVVRPPRDLLPLIEQLSGAMETACRLRDESMKTLTKEDLDFIKAQPDLFFYENGMFRFMSSPVSQQMKIIRILRKVDTRLIFQAGQIVSRAIEDVVPGLKEIAGRPSIASAQILYEANYPWGTMLVTGTRDNEHTRRAALIVDLGGRDTYLNNAGGTGIGAFGVAAVLDLSGNDIYRSNEIGVQGFGFLGSGLIYDCEGDDVYEAGMFSQGGCFCGCGYIYDIDGDDRYHATLCSQACASFGMGGIIDLAGDDQYSAEELTQGFASTLGLGVLYDRAGNDVYRCSLKKNGFAQGSGCGCRSYPWLMDYSIYGGCGFLVDDDGDDRYLAGSFSQGASYFYSMGALVDRKGNDYYKAEGSYSHGAGVHLTNGYLMDNSGDDIYIGQWAGNAVGNDRSAGIFLDAAGQDRYYAPDGDGQAYSHKPLGFSLFIDASGDDVYQAEAHSQAYVLPPITPDNWSTALFVDLGGRDYYSMPGRINDSEWSSDGNAAGIDTEESFVSDAFFPPVWSAGEVSEAVIPDAFLMFNLAGSYWTDPGADSADRILKGLTDSDALIRRASEEALTVMLIEENLPPGLADGLAAALGFTDPGTRAFAVMTIDLHELAECGEALVDRMSEPDPYIRKMIYRSIGNLHLFGAHVLLKKAIHTESDPVSKGYALAALAKYELPEYESVFAACMNDPDDFVRMSSAYALGRIRARTSHSSLIKGISDPSPYVRKASGEALLQCGFKEGLKPMIEYLNYRALDTSSDNYGSNLGAVLMEYTNQDFGRDYVRWMDWYKAEGETFDLENNLKSRENYLSAVRALRKNETQEALDRFEQALKDNPGYRKVLTEYASLLNTLAWQKVTSPQTHADLAEGLKLARRCVELDPQAMYIDTLAEACYQNGLVEEAIEHQKKAVELEPETEEYQSRLEMLLRRSANHL